MTENADLNVLIRILLKTMSSLIIILIVYFQDFDSLLDYGSSEDLIKNRKLGNKQ